MVVPTRRGQRDLLGSGGREEMEEQLEVKVGGGGRWEEVGGGRRWEEVEEKKTTLVKSNNPPLAGGK